MSELFPGPAAGFDHPIEILEACHQRIRRHCALVARIGRHLDEKGANDEARQAARSVLRYFDEAGRNHHRDEEEDLFPALARCAGNDRDEAAALVDLLRAEHVALDAAWEAMRARLAAVAEGAAQAITAEDAAAFAGAYERHMEVEEARLFPLARRALDAATIAALGEAMARRRGVAPP